MERELARIWACRPALRECLCAADGGSPRHARAGSWCADILGRRQVREALRVRSQSMRRAREASQNSTDGTWFTWKLRCASSSLLYVAADSERVSVTDAASRRQLRRGPDTVLPASGLAFLSTSVLPFTRISTATRPNVRPLATRHRQMLAAIAGRQPDAAEQASRLHIQEAIDLVHDEEVN